ncbi:MAG: hypothetical protein QM780_06975 [Hyphomicrobium sp.]|uniref:hypothetical protein n=1 Tax=Hyphomicrobium sp. TaxID=82 RepID=UPI0039E455A8
MAAKEPRPGWSVNRPECSKQFSKVGGTPGRAAMPLLDDPVGVLSDPFRHFDLAVHQALSGAYALTFEIQRDVFATGRIVDQADGDDKFNHQDLQKAVWQSLVEAIGLALDGSSALLFVH